MVGISRVLLLILGKSKGFGLFIVIYADECRYNMSYIIQQGALNDKPVLGVSINYRMAAFGFLDSEEVRVRYIIPNISLMGG